MGVPWRVARGVCRGPFRGYYRGCRKGCCRQGACVGFKGYCRACRGCCRALCTGMSHGVLRGGFGVHCRPYRMGRLNGLCRWCYKAVCPSCSYLIRVLVLYEHLRKNARIFVILSYFLLFRAPSTHCELLEPVQSYGNNSAMWRVQFTHFF